MRRTLALLLLTLPLTATAQGRDDPRPALREKLAPFADWVGSWSGVDLTPGLPVFPDGKLIERRTVISAQLDGTIHEWRHVHTPPGAESAKILDVLRWDRREGRYIFERFGSWGNRADLAGQLEDGKTLSLNLVRPQGGMPKLYQYTLTDRDHLFVERWALEQRGKVLLGRGYMTREGARPLWSQLARGWLSGREARGWKRFRTAAEWQAFRAEASLVVPRDGVRAVDRKPLPEHDFATGQLVLIWTEATFHRLRLHSVDAARVVLDAPVPPGAEMSQRPLGVGAFVLLRLTTTDDGFEVVWK